MRNELASFPDVVCSLVDVFGFGIPVRFVDLTCLTRPFQNAGNKMTGLLPPPPSLLDVKPNLMNLAVNPPSASGGNRPAGLMNEPDITNPAMQSLLAQSPQGKVQNE